ncbi:alpha/beta fold hydrolase [Roseomonas mucosa]
MIAMVEKARIEGLRSETVTVDGVRLHYWIGGPEDGRPVLLWHGFLSTGFAWRDVAPELAKAGMAVLVPDMRGFGDSDKPDGAKGYDARALAEEFRSLVAAIGFGGGQPLIVAAHDMGAPPALIWAADHPDEIAALLYIEAPVMLGDVLGKVIAYNRQAMAQGSMWWWILPLTPGVPERLIVGNERAFLTWFYEGATARPKVFDHRIVEEYLRTFTGRTGVLGAMGVYRATFDSIDQTEPLKVDKVDVPVIAIGGVKGLGDKVGEGVARVAESVSTETIEDCGHFVPEERPDVVIRHIWAIAAKLP